MNDAGVAPPRGDAHPAADRGAAYERHPVSGQLLPGLEHDLRIDLGGDAVERQPFLHRQQNLSDAEQSDHRDEEVEALHQARQAECQTQLSGHDVDADRRKRKSEHHRNDDLPGRPFAHADEAAERQQIDREKFRRPELEREARDQRGEKRDQQDGDERADERRSERCGQRLAGASFLRQWIAVERGRDRPRLAGDVEQDRGDCAAEQGTPVNARQHDDGRGRRHRERQRQQDRDAVGGTQTGQHAYDHAQDDPEEHQADVERREYHRESVKQ
jgi:hypothetical protein